MFTKKPPKGHELDCIYGEYFAFQIQEQITALNCTIKEIEINIGNYKRLKTYHETIKSLPWFNIVLPTSGMNDMRINFKKSPEEYATVKNFLLLDDYQMTLRWKDRMTEQFNDPYKSNKNFVERLASI